MAVEVSGVVAGNEGAALRDADTADRGQQLIELQARHGNGSLDNVDAHLGALAQPLHDAVLRLAHVHHPLIQLGHLEAQGLAGALQHLAAVHRSEEHTSELQSLMRISYAVFCLKKKKKDERQTNTQE